MTHYPMTMNRAPQAPPPAAQDNSKDLFRPTLLGEKSQQFGVQRGAFVFSLAFNGAIIAAILLFYIYAAVHPPTLLQSKDLMIPVDMDKKSMPMGAQAPHGGGGNTGATPPQHGVPPKTTQYQIVPPSVSNRNHLLEVDPSINAPHLTAGIGQIGGLNTNGLGMGMNGGTGVGSGRGSGYGNGTGGGWGGGSFAPGNGVSAPKPLYQPEPEYSEEGRKAKVQGEAVLEIVVGADGRVRDARVIRSLGFGLDQEAIKTVKTWRFEPGKKQGQNVDVRVQVVVDFRLY